MGGLMATLRFDAAEAQADGLLTLLVADRLPALMRRPGVVGAHLCRADLAASRVKTEEKKSRPVGPRVPEWVVLVEGGAGRAELSRAVGDLLDAASLSARGAHDAERGLYALQACLTK
jgi:hypothetical protein